MKPEAARFSRVILIVALLCLLLVVGGTYASICESPCPGPGCSWCDPACWAPLPVPGPGDDVVLDPPPDCAPTIDCNVHVNSICGPQCSSDDDQVMQVLSGDVVIDNNWTAGLAGTGTGTLCISGDAQVTVGGTMHLADQAPFILAVSDTALLTVDSLIAASEDAATLEITGGGIVVTGELTVPAYEDGSATIGLHAGTITCGSFTHLGQDWSMYITDGVMIIDGDVSADIQADADAGRITAFGGRGELMVDFNNVNTAKTTVWAEPEFKRAWNPNPADRAIDVASHGTVLSWLPGDGAQAHYVYMSTDYDSVANRAPEAYKRPCYGHDNTSLPASPLLLGETYYWAVDELSTGSVVTPGNVWQFSVEHCRIIEDMDSYHRNANPIRETWFDGCGYWVDELLISNHTGSCVEITVKNTHSGPKAMVYSYDNYESSIWERCGSPSWERCPVYSESTRVFDPALDLSSCGEKALVVWFYGNGDNDSTAMWVTLNWVAHTYGTNGEDPNDIKKPEWIDWNTRLSDFAAGGVDLSNVSELAIGFGDRITGQPDNSYGRVYFDDIAVYPRRCVPRFAASIVDLNGDCTTDIKDVILMSYFWLEDRR